MVCPHAFLLPVAAHPAWLRGEEARVELTCLPCLGHPYLEFHPMVPTHFLATARHLISPVAAVGAGAPWEEGAAEGAER